MYKMTRLLVSRKVSIHLFPVIVSVSLLIYLAVEYIKLFQYLERTPHQPYLVFMRFLYSGRTENPGKKTLGARRESTTKPRPHWWEASSLTTTPSLLPRTSFTLNVRSVCIEFRILSLFICL